MDATAADRPAATLPVPRADARGADATTDADLPVVVIGAGPVGLVAAAHLAARGLPFLVLEAGPAVGSAVRAWGHIRTFTPWQHIVDPAAERLLARTGWTRPTTPVPPTGAELVERYLEPLADVLLPGAAGAAGDRAAGPAGRPPHDLGAGGLRLGHRVLAVTRDGWDKGRTVGRDARPFLVRVRDDAGQVHDVRARAVLDASGTWGRPNPLGSSGLPARGEEAAADVLVGPLPDVLGRDRARFAGRTTLVVGAGHSAANTLLALGRLAVDEPGTRLLWAIRATEPSRVYGGGEADELPARGALGADLRRLVDTGVVELVPGFAVTAVERDADRRDGAVTVVGSTAAGPRRLEGVHAVAAATGFRPDLTMLAELRLDLDPGLESPRALGPLIDPAFHSCGTVPPHGHRELAHPEPGFYVVGMKSYGRAPTFLLTTGNEQVRSVVAALAGDTADADEVRLVLPETGVCSVDAAGRDTATGGCCGTPTGVDGLTVPSEAHRALPPGIPARGFATGLPGGGRVAELALRLTDVGVRRSPATPTTTTGPTSTTAATPTSTGCGTGGGCCAG